jgi:hypothetical protein
MNPPHFRHRRALRVVDVVAATVCLANPVRRVAWPCGAPLGGMVGGIAQR